MSLAHAIQALSKVRQETDSILVSYSGGKESLVCLLLACQMFKHVSGFQMVLVDGLEVDRKKREYAFNKFGVKIIPILGPGFFNYKRAGVYCAPQEIVPREVDLDDIYTTIRNQTQIEWISIGFRQDDGIFRRLMLRGYEDEAICRASKKVFPCSRWKKAEVIAYLKNRNILVPANMSKTRASNGVSLHQESLKFLKQYYPNDFLKIKSHFPLCDLYEQKEAIYQL